MTLNEEPPDPRTARQKLTDYLGRTASGEVFNGELSFYGSSVIRDIRDKIPKLSDHGAYARALEDFSVTCYRGVSGSEEAIRVLDAFESELVLGLSQERAKKLKEGMDLINKALS